MKLSCTCNPVTKDGHDFVPWIAWIFRQCYYTPAEVASFVLGLANIFFWLFAQIPQIISNFKTRSSEALSFTFILTQLLGDASNLIGCILTHQLPTQIYTAVYFCSMDVILIWQWVYYKAKKDNTKSLRTAIVGRRRRARREKNYQSTERYKPVISDGAKNGVVSVCMCSGVVLVFAAFVVQKVYGWYGGVESFYAGRRLFAAAEEGSAELPLCNEASEITFFERVVGSVSAWVCFGFYFFGRIPQCIHNYRRKSTEGLSIFLFLVCTLANIAYGTSIVILPIDVHDTRFWEATLPYILGSYGCIIAPSIVVFQFFYYTYYYPKKHALLINNPEELSINADQA